MKSIAIDSSRFVTIGLFGFGVVQLALWLPFVPAWDTFIYGWSVELGAAVLFVFVIAAFLARSLRNPSAMRLESKETVLVILPIVSFICWSAASVLWSASWKSSVLHTSTWIIYLAFYITVRQLLERADGFRRLQTTIVLTLVLVCTPAVVEYCAYLILGGSTDLNVRYAKWGEQIVTILPLLLVGALRKTGKDLAIAATAIILMGLMVVGTFGRTNIFLFASVLALVGSIVFLHRRYVNWRLKFVSIIASFAVSLVIVNSLSQLADQPMVPILNRIENSENLNASNNYRRLMYSISAVMIAERPLLGVGAGNFWAEFNEFRGAYGRANPDDPNLAVAEHEVAGHAHNEFLQILVELGIIGGILIGWLLIGIGVIAYKSLRRVIHGSMFPAAAVMGLLAFLASSLVSAYSFRVMQNGFVFFFVLAVAAKLVLKDHKSEPRKELAMLSPRALRMACAVCMLACLSLGALSVLRVSNAIAAARANRTSDLNEAAEFYHLATRLDDENPNAYQNFGLRLFASQRYREAIPYLTHAIKIGRGPSAEYSYLASAHFLDGDPTAAEAVIAEAVDLYPQSAFVLTRYAALLLENGKTSESERVFQRALRIDERVAKTWWALINQGPKATSDLAARDKSYMFVMELKPESSMYAVVNERYIRYPEERRFSAVNR